MKAAARSGDNDDGNPDTDLVVRCSNVQRNIFNEATCKISYHEDACTSVPLPDPDDLYRSVMYNPGDRVEDLRKYLPEYAGPANGGVIGEPTMIVHVLNTSLCAFTECLNTSMRIRTRSIANCH